MTLDRIKFALSAGELEMPSEGPLAFWGARAEEAQSLEYFRDRVRIITGFYPDYNALKASGYVCATGPDERYSASFVFLPRARDLARLRIAEAVAATDGPVWVDGAKTNGVESLLRDCRARGEVGAVISKSHGKLFQLPVGADFSDWFIQSKKVAGGYMTAPGVFSADAVDAASALLAETLPEKLGAHVVDLGGGWGYLSSQILQRSGVKQLDVVEADYAAIKCCERNLEDERVTLHWNDALQWYPDTKVETVVSNPPFHIGRAPDPSLGEGFIRSASGMLRPSGCLWLVANRHLPYERTMSDFFKTQHEVAGDKRFKVLVGKHPRG